MVLGHGIELGHLCVSVCACVTLIIHDRDVHVLGARHHLAINHFLDYGAYTLGHLGCAETRDRETALDSCLEIPLNMI